MIWLRQMLTIPQKEDHLCAVLRWQEGDVLLAYWLPDFNHARFVPPRVAHHETGTVHSVGKFEITSAAFLRHTEHTWFFTAPVHTDGAGGLAMS